MSQYAVLQAWESFKSAALSSGLPITEALPRFALEKWAEAAADRPGSPGRAMREAVTASIVGAALTDIAIDKLAAEGAYTEPEREYLRQLNAEAALGDLGFLFKSALSLDPFRNHPKLTGGVVGGMLGAGFGAWKDEDNRVRGALAYGVPGAAIGALGGHLYEGHKERVMDLLKKEREEQAARELASRTNDRKIQALEEGIQGTRQLIDDAETTRAKARGQRELQAFDTVLAERDAERAEHGYAPVTHPTSTDVYLAEAQAQLQSQRERALQENAARDAAHAHVDRAMSLQPHILPIAVAHGHGQQAITDADVVFQRYGQQLTDHFKEHGINAPLPLSVTLHVDNLPTPSRNAFNFMLRHMRDYASRV